MPDRRERDAGRDHWPKVFSIVLAGGGIKQGSVYGSSDHTAAEPDTDPLALQDLSATLYHCLGINGEKRLIAPGNRPVRIVDNGKPCGTAGVNRFWQLPIARLGQASAAITGSQTRAKTMRVEPRSSTRLLIAATAILTTSFCVRLLATQPDVQHVVPPGGQRGTEVDLSIDGKRLDDAQEMLWYDSGISVKSLDFVEKKVKVKLDLAPIAHWANTLFACALKPV